VTFIFANAGVDAAVARYRGQLMRAELD